MVLKLWSLDQQHRYHLELARAASSPAPALDLLNQTLWGRGPVVCAVPSPRGVSGTLGLKATVLHKTVHPLWKADVPIDRPFIVLSPVKDVTVCEMRCYLLRPSQKEKTR